MLGEFIKRLESGESTPDQLLQECLRRIAACDADVRAWAVVNPQPATGDGPLRGIPFGAKDIIDTEGLDTAWGSDLYAGRRPKRDAAIVADLRRSGAVLVGKTATAPFAYFDPPATNNPRAAGRTPGGSSSGSAAAVAARMVPFALGTQTQGSVLRPASFCGVCGFKPSYGLLSMEGILPFARSLDTLGLFTETVADMELLWARGFGGGVTATLDKAACMPLPSDDEMAQAVTRAIEQLRAAGVEVDMVEPPPGFDRLADAVLIIDEYEGARTHQERWREYGERIGVHLAALVERGLAISASEYEVARETASEMRLACSALFWEYPVLLTPAALGAAPLGLESTGDPIFNAPWTALGTPAISIPLPVDGPPLGLQAVGAWGRDDAVISVAAQAESILLQST